ncbi:MAG: glutamine-hydrolyzing carbamoyl-phosphate synthase small subunit [Duodenibacillus sp.]|nr:glutamine-hydrolyzing carbamoyl-phosphate synthase small subunit [Duodenibacillus sp.]
MSSIICDARPQAALVLADGSVFTGRSVGAAGSVTAEVVFNTAMTGYQEILTDPSYTGQIVTLTYPHIGNTGVNAQDEESRGVCASGLVIRCESPLASSFRSQSELGAYLKAAGVVAIADIDTRRLTRILRDKGAQPGCITVAAAADGRLSDAEIAAAGEAARGWGSMVGRDYASQVTCAAPYDWCEGSWTLKGEDGAPGFTRPEKFKYFVVAYDFGVKRNILRLMADRGIRVRVVPARTPVEDVLALNPDGVFLSNGPGDPEPCTYAIEAARACLERKVPLFGICLGHQIMGLACGGKTVKMKFGHHGGNHPVVDEATRRVHITSQNHGFAVDAESLPMSVMASHASLFDGSLQGLRFIDAPAFSFQGHPEASPGPHDIEVLFDRFVEMMRRNRH